MESRDSQGNDMDLRHGAPSPTICRGGSLSRDCASNQRQKTFTVESDYQAYIERLARYRKKYDYVLHAYCLMPNHVHLLVESSEQPLAKFMQGLQQSSPPGMTELEIGT